MSEQPIIPDHEPVGAEAIVAMFQRLVDSVCVVCGEEPHIFEQVGRSYIARPCNHRQGQGSAQFFNARLAAKRGLT